MSDGREDDSHFSGPTTTTTTMISSGGRTSIRITTRGSSFWDDADVGGSGSTYGDARARAAAADSRSPHWGRGYPREDNASDAATTGSPPSYISVPGGGGGRHASASLWSELLKSALLGGAAALGYHLTSVMAKILIRRVEERCRGNLALRRDGENAYNDSSDIADSLATTRYTSRLCEVIRQVAVRLQRGAAKLKHHVKIRLMQLKSTWPLLVLAASWPYLLRNRSSRGCRGGGRYGKNGRESILRLLLGPLALLYVLGGNDDDDNDGNDDDNEGNGSSGNSNQLPPPAQSSFRSRSRSNPTTTPATAGTMSDSNLMDTNNNSNNDRTRSDSIATQTSTSSALVAGENTGKAPPARYVELLVHNVSHTDLVLGVGQRRRRRNTGGGMMALVAPNTTEANVDPEEQLRQSAIRQMSAEDGTRYLPAATVSAPTSDDDDDDEEQRLLDEYALCRPRFSAFDLFTRRVLDSIRSKLILGQDLANAVVSFPRYERSDVTSRYNLVTPKMKNRERMLPVGFELSGKDAGGSDDIDDRLTVPADEIPSLRVRGRDVHKMGPVYESALRNHWVGVAEQQQQNDTTTDTHRFGDELSGQLSNIRLSGVFFPLLATLLRRWHADIADKYDSASSGRKVKKVLILVSGVGSPRNWTHSISGNSTQACAELMEMFIKVMYPDVTVVRIHSETNIFRYDENISFAKNELLPCVNAYRDAHARGEPYPDESRSAPAGEVVERATFDPDWKQAFSVALSFADGSPARTHAIQASLRHTYRPTYYHFWQLKTFWHDSKLSDEDIEVHPFEEMETVPAMDVAKINDEQVKLVIDEMKAFRKHFLETLDENRNDIRTFWLRKTKKPVLAVLLVADPKDGGKPQLYRGTNMEVSMPTGSLCAERNVIGTALATNPGLRREDLRMVAVLAIPLSKEEPSKVGFAPQIPTSPPGLDPSMSAVVGSSSQMAQVKAAASADSSTGASFPEGKQFLSEVQRKLEDEQTKQQSTTGMRRTYSSASFSSIIEEKDSSSSSKDDSSLSWTVAEIPKLVGGSIDSTTGDGPASATKARAEKNVSSYRPLAFHESIDLAQRPSMSPPGTPMRKIKLNTSNFRPTWGGGGSRKKRTVVVHSSEDINPLRPCGACNEWLKKIAESNPYFRVLTFTDADCNGVYCTPCQE